MILRFKNPKPRSGALLDADMIPARCSRLEGRRPDLAAAAEQEQCTEAAEQRDAWLGDHIHIEIERGGGAIHDEAAG